MQGFVTSMWQASELLTASSGFDIACLVVRSEGASMSMQAIGSERQAGVFQTHKQARPVNFRVWQTCCSQTRLGSVITVSLRDITAYGINFDCSIDV
jgi:hypothetical protein